MVPSRSRGLVLIVVLGVLVLMALLATSFFTLQTIERRVTHNYTDEVRAKLAAQSGVEFAIGRLQNIIQEGWFKNGRFDKSWIYYGSTLDEAQDPNVRTRLTEAVNPSFAWEDEDPQNPSDGSKTPKTVLIEGQLAGFSGYVAGTYTPRGDLYSLKVLDAQSMINVNDGVAWGPNHSVSRNLRRLLNVLGEQLNLQGWKKVPGSPTEKLGNLILSRRPPGGYRSKEELLPLFDNDPVRFSTVSALLTTRSWQHPAVAEPVPLSAQALSAYPAEITYGRPTLGAKPIYRYGHGLSAAGVPITMPLNFFDGSGNPPNYAAVLKMDALNPQWIELVERSPVNINTAAKEVLAALLVDLEGFFVTSRRRATPKDIFYGWVHAVNYYDAGNPPVDNPPYLTSNGELGFLYRTAPVTGDGSRWGSPPNPISAAHIAEEITHCRESRVSPLTGVDYAAVPFGGPFRSWAQFNAFVDSLVGENRLIWDRRPVYVDYAATFDPPRMAGGQVMFMAGSTISVVSNDPGVTIAAAGPVLVAEGTGHLRIHSDTPFVSVTSNGGFQVQGYPGNYDIEGDLVSVPSGEPPTFNHSMGDSFVQRWHGSMAVADAIKANFNPNLHLNELNPDRIMHRRVDKTDLLVHSTEFCFVPMGIFEIESLGTVLDNDAPESGTVLGLGPIASWDNRIVARKRVSALVQLYEPIHVTSQSQLYLGSFAARQSSAGLTTNNNRSVESGPEPDNGPAPLECDWDGYVALPTRLGSFSGQPISYEKPKGQLMTNLQGVPGAVPPPNPGASEFGEAIHSHFQFDFFAGYHKGGAADKTPLGIQPSLAEPYTNFPDRTETRRGPYAPADPPSGNTPGKRYGLCRSFRRDPLNPVTGVLPLPPARFEYASSDLRVDGAYLELHSATGYSLLSAPLNVCGVVSFWYKPNYFPEQLGKTRNLFSMSRDTTAWPQPFGLYLLPCWHSSETFTPFYNGPSRKLSMLLGLGINELRGGVGSISKTLNHEFEPQVSASENESRFFGKLDGKYNDLRGHEWCHVIAAFEAGTAQLPPAPTPPVPPPGTRRLSIYVNGKLSSDPDLWVHINDNIFNMALAHGNSIRLGGEISGSCILSGQGQNGRNFYADGTLDEFFFWSNTNYLPGTVQTATQIYNLGRYYKPNDSNVADARFTSSPLAIPFSSRRLAPCDAIVPPPGAPAGASPPPSDASSQKVIVAVSWTALAEDYVAGQESDGRPRLRPVMHDYSPQKYSDAAAPADLSPANLADANGYAYETVCDLSIGVQGASYGPYRNEPWSPIRASHSGVPTGSGSELVIVTPSDSVTFSAKLRVGPVNANSILLATPVLDDVTIFVADASARYLAYAEVRQ
jgi:hypothetical protein